MINQPYPPKDRPNQATRRPLLFPKRRYWVLHLDSVTILLIIAILFLVIVLWSTFR